MPSTRMTVRIDDLGSLIGALIGYDGRPGLIQKLISEVGSIAHGDATTPGGLEALAMSISGPGTATEEQNLTSAIRDAGDVISAGLSDIATAIESLAASLAEKSEQHG